MSHELGCPRVVAEARDEQNNIAYTYLSGSPCLCLSLRAAYRRGVQAARDAVDGLWGNCYYECKNDALAAIDGLLESK